MEYRINRRTGDRIGVIGLGASSLHEAKEKEGVETLRYAYENGVNYFDLAASESSCFSYYRRALGDVRGNVMYQVHFGAVYADGEYGWTTERDAVARETEKRLAELGTDYIDYGFIHCIDEPKDWDDYRKGALGLLLDYKARGIVRHIGLSSHSPSIIGRLLDEKLPDIVMFSINPAYDRSMGEYALGDRDERAAVCLRCEREGVGITVMKPFSGGQLLDARTSPLKVALTEYQCISYALSRPGVVTTLPGVRGLSDVKRLLGYFDADEKEKDLSFLKSVAFAEYGGKCVYCNHCRPCPVGLDIGMINKYYDLSRAGDALASDHYRKLTLHASDCIDCGHCKDRCPFGVDQPQRMKEIAAYFGR